MLVREGREIMAIEENKALGQRYLEEVYNNKNLTVIDELIAPNLVVHAYGPPSDYVARYTQRRVRWYCAYWQASDGNSYNHTPR
jgi:hypothetical protein